MTISSPTGYDVISANELGFVKIGEVLPRILGNVNYLFLKHQPPLVSVCYMTALADTSDPVYRIPIVPSADGIDYTFRHQVTDSGGGSTVTITVEEYDGGWNTIHTSAGQAIATTATLDYSHTDTISDTATELRITYASAGDDIQPQGLLVYPDPASVPTGTQPSGFVAYDDGILGTTNNPVTTEHVDRCRQSAVAVLRDRRQMVCSLVQDTGTPQYDSTDQGGGGAAYMRIGSAEAWLPGGPCELTVYAYGNVSSGAATKVRLVQVAGNSVDLDLDGTVQSGALEVTPDADGFVRFDAYMQRPTGRDAYLYALVAFWRPGD